MLVASFYLYFFFAKHSTWGHVRVHIFDWPIGKDPTF